MRKKKQHNKKSTFQKAEDEIADDTENRSIVNNLNRLPFLIIGIVVAIILVIGAYFLFVHDFGNSTEKTENGQDENFIEGMRHYSSDNYEEAKKYFQKTYYSKLDSSDQNMIVDMYIDHEDYQEAIDDYYNADKRVVDYLYNNEEERKIRDLKPSTKLIELEQAILIADYTEIAKLADKHDIDMNERRAKAVAQAYHKTGEDQKASKFSDDMLKEGIDPFNTGEQQKVVQEEKSASIWTILLWSVLGIVILVALIIGVLFLFRKKIPYRVALTPSNSNLALTENKFAGSIPVLSGDTSETQQSNKLMPPSVIEDEYEKLDQDKRFVQREKDYVESMKQQNDIYAKQIEEKEKEMAETKKELEREEERLKQQGEQNAEAEEYYKVLKSRQEKQKKETAELYQDRENVQYELMKERDKTQKLAKENQQLKNMLQSNQAAYNIDEIDERIESEQDSEQLNLNYEKFYAEDTINVEKSNNSIDEAEGTKLEEDSKEESSNNQEIEASEIENEATSDKDDRESNEKKSKNTTDQTKNLEQKPKDKKPKKPVLKSKKQDNNEFVSPDSIEDDDEYSYDFDDI